MLTFATHLPILKIQMGLTGIEFMGTERPPAEVNIHLRAKAHDRLLIDQAAELLGSNRSQFMMASALKEAKNVILDQTSFYVDNKTFQKVLDWLDTPATQEQIEGIGRLKATKSLWSSDWRQEIYHTRTAYRKA